MRALPVLLLVACARLEPAPPVDPPDDTDVVGGPVRIRLATWNVEGIGSGDELDATAAILARLDADVVALNEVDELEDARLADLAAGLGYEVVLPSDNPFGGLRNAVLSRLPIVEDVVWRSDALSGDAEANDLTRWPVSVTVNAGPATLAVVAQHCKSGFDDIDELRRAVDAIRTAQAAERAPGDLVIVLGDLNADLADDPQSPDPFTSIPPGAPSGWWLGGDLYDRLEGEGIPNDPFAPLVARGLVPLDAQQADGRSDTRDASGRRIDYLVANPEAASAVQATLVYDSRDEERIALALAGDPPAREASGLASDHFPVVADLALD